ncbi:MAG TPA: hypothetical protein PLQ79_04015 [Candidatus Cloacimonadota bacterium]|nr:hypothetical protein [Candidatus Cloacimonadota bacterium]
MGETKEKGNGLITQLVPAMVITVTAIFLNWICNSVLFIKGYPGFLSISGTINTSDLLIGVFTAQVAMVTIAIAFSGLLIQLVNSGEKYLGLTLREVILSRTYHGITLLSLMGTSLFSSILSYYFVAQHQIVSALSLFIANIFIVFILFRCYIKNATKVGETQQFIRCLVVQDAVLAVNEENNTTEANLNEHKQLGRLNKPLYEIRNSLSQSIIDNNRIDFIGYSEFLVDLIELVSDKSISPNRSTILKSLFDIVSHVSILLLEKCEYDQFSEFSEMSVKRYYKRNSKNETGDVVSYLAGDLVISFFIKAIYDKTCKLATESYYSLHLRIMQLDCLKKLHFLFISDFKSSVFEQIVPKYFSAINENATLSKDEKTHIVSRSIKELYRITERDLGKFHEVKPLMSKDIVIDSYIFDWTSILKQLYLNSDKELIELVFSFMNSPTLGNDLVEKKLYPCLAINLLMMAITDLHYEHGDKVSLLSFDINGKYNKYYGITEYIRSQLLPNNLELLKRSYLTMVKLVEAWKERSNRLTTFDYSPETFLIIVVAFMYKPHEYPEILKWTVVDRLPRIDRFSDIIDEIKKCISKYPDNESTTNIERIFISYIAVFESTKYPLENEASRIISNLDMLKNEAISLLSAP